MSWYNVTKTVEILKELQGAKHLIIGNHDKSFLKNGLFRSCFESIDNYKEIEGDDGHGIVLCHYPIPTYKNHYYGWRHFYGHVHSSFEWNMIEHFQHDMVNLYDKKSNMFNVGCMMPYMYWAPQTAADIEKNYQNWKAYLNDGV